MIDLTQKRTGGIFVDAPNGSYVAVVADISEPYAEKSNSLKYADSVKVEVAYQLNALITLQHLQAAAVGVPIEQLTPELAASGQAKLKEDDLKRVGQPFVVRSWENVFGKGMAALVAATNNNRTMDELSSSGKFDQEALIYGKPVLLSVKTEGGLEGGKPRPRIKNVMPLILGMESSIPTIHPCIVRKRDRPAKSAGVTTPTTSAVAAQFVPPVAVPPVYVPTAAAPVAQLDELIAAMATPSLTGQSATI